MEKFFEYKQNQEWVRYDLPFQNTGLILLFLVKKGLNLKRQKSSQTCRKSSLTESVIKHTVGKVGPCEI